MTQPIPPDQFNHILQLITPYMGHQNRHSYITPWCASHPNLYGRIDWTGPDRSFAVHAVELFHNYGLVDPDKRALNYFLEAVQDDMGEPDRSEISDILAALAQQETELFRKSSVSTTYPLPSASLRAPHFTGRDKLLEELKTELQPGKMVALCGPGGIGKTSLAVEAHAQRLFNQRQLLLILDGAEDAADLPAVVNLRGNCGVLITSRQREDAWSCKRLDVEPFTDEDAVALLLQLVDNERCDRETALAICQRLGNLPLAVQLAGRDMDKNGFSGPLFLEWLQETSLEVLDQGKRRQESVPVLLERSLTAVSEPAKEALALIGQLALAPVDHTLLAPALGQEALQMTRVLGELVNLSLLRTTAEGRYSVTHALIHTYASEQLKPDTECLIRLGETYAEFAERQSELGLVGYVRLDPERVHLLTLAQACVDVGLWSAVDGLIQDVDGYLDIQGHWTQRIILLQLGVQSAQTLANSRNESLYLGNLGNAYSDLGQVAEAIDYYEQALTISRDSGDRSGEGRHLGNLGNVYSDLGRAVEAIDYYEQALTISRDSGDRRGEGIDLGNLGLAYRDLGQVAEAIDYYEQALTIAREIGDRRGEGRNLGNLGGAYRVLGQMAEAIDYHEQALIIARKIGDRRGEGYRLSNLGNAYSDLGRVAEAMDYYDQALTIAREISDRTGEGVRLINWGRTQAVSGHGSKAISLCQQGLDIHYEIGHRSGVGH